jgi:hypothetical protein
MYRNLGTTTFTTILHRVEDLTSNILSNFVPILVVVVFDVLLDKRAEVGDFTHDLLVLGDLRGYVGSGQWRLRRRRHRYN